MQISLVYLGIVIPFILIIEKLMVLILDTRHFGVLSHIHKISSQKNLLSLIYSPKI